MGNGQRNQEIIVGEYACQEMDFWLVLQLPLAHWQQCPLAHLQTIHQVLVEAMLR